LAIVPACFLPIHITAEMANPTVYRPSICPEAVSIFGGLSEVRKSYSKVAELIPPPGGAEYMPDPHDVVRAQRKKAGQLGANGLVIELQRPEHGRYNMALAIFIPEDSMLATTTCTLGLAK